MKEKKKLVFLYEKDILFLKGLKRKSMADAISVCIETVKDVKGFA